MKKQKRHPSLVRFLARNGHDEELARAKLVFRRNKDYRVKCGRLGRYDCRLEIEGIDGEWNSVMFNADTRALHDAGLLTLSYYIPARRP